MAQAVPKAENDADWRAEPVRVGVSEPVVKPAAEPRRGFPPQVLSAWLHRLLAAAGPPV